MLRCAHSSASLNYIFVSFTSSTALGACATYCHQRQSQVVAQPLCFCRIGEVWYTLNNTIHNVQEIKRVTEACTKERRRKICQKAQSFLCVTAAHVVHYPVYALKPNFYLSNQWVWIGGGEVTCFAMCFKNIARHCFKIIQMFDFTRFYHVPEFKVQDNSFSMAQVFVSSFCCGSVDFQSLLN